MTEKLIFREADLNDILQIQRVRHSVKENRLSNPSLVTDSDCEDYFMKRGRGWVCEINGYIVGFAIADLRDSNVCALFIDPEFESKGIGRKLHDEMIDWYFDQTDKPIWLGTAPGTRAEKFYRKAGWQEIGLHGKGEIKFEMSQEDWLKIRNPLPVGQAGKLEIRNSLPVRKVRKDSFGDSLGAGGEIRNPR